MAEEATDLQAQYARALNLLSSQILGWKVLEGESGELRLRREWTLRNFQAGLDLFERIAKVAEEQGHHPDLHLTGWNKASVELYSHELGQLKTAYVQRRLMVGTDQRN